MKNKIALIFGVTGQDGSYLAKFLLKKGYIVHGVKRRSSSINTSRVDDIYENPFIKNKKFFLHYGDVTDTLSVGKIIQKTKPKEIYNLGGVEILLTSIDFEGTGMGFDIELTKNVSETVSIPVIK